MTTHYLAYSFCILVENYNISEIFMLIYWSIYRIQFASHNYNLLLCTTQITNTMKEFIKDIGVNNIPNDSIVIGEDLALIPINNSTIATNHY